METGQQNRSKRKDRVTKMMSDFVPTFDVRAEEVVLGSAMVDNAACAILMSDLNPEYFYTPLTNAVAEAVRQLIGIGTHVDVVTVIDQLRKNGRLETVGGYVAVNKLVNHYASSATIPTYLKIVKEHWMRRQLGVLGNDISYKATQDEISGEEIVQQMQGECLRLTSAVVRSNAMSSSDILPSVFTEMESRINMEHGIVGVPSGYAEIDQITGGWREGRMYVLAGRPSMGKTTLALNYAWRASAVYNKTVLVLSLEMTSRELVVKFLSMITGVTTHQVDAGLFQKHEIDRMRQFGSRAGNDRLIIDDCSSGELNPMTLRSKIFEQKAKGGCDFVIVDYLQLMSSGVKTNNENEETSIISRQIKLIAKEMQVPILALSQLSRDVEKDSASGRPKLRHLRNSGSIEQDADMVSFVYRPGYYKQKDEFGNLIGDDVAELMIAKHRGGALADISLKCILSASRFYGRDPHDADRYESETIYTGIKNGF
jgi:replicative DNA helicase